MSESFQVLRNQLVNMVNVMLMYDWVAQCIKLYLHVNLINLFIASEHTKATVLSTVLAALCSQNAIFTEHFHLQDKGEYYTGTYTVNHK